MRLELAERMHALLSAIVQEYIETSMPVSSRAALIRAKLAISPATVRTMMGQLEELGLLCQPHRSSGRIPTDLGFRAYVDALLAALPDTRPTVRALRAGEPFPAPSQATQIEGVLRGAVEALSRETGQLAFSVGLPREHAVLRELRFVRVSHDRVLAMLVYRSGAVETGLFDELECTQPMLDRASAQLSEWIAGLTLSEARAALRSDVSRAREREDEPWRLAATLARAGTERSAVDVPFYLAERIRLLSQPDFEDVSRVRDVFLALEERERMLALLEKVMTGPSLRIGIGIGEELDDPEMRWCAVVIAPLSETSPRCGIGVIGPVRMRYDRVIPAVRALSARVASALS
jgi:heat-inducible transcriptional repressor